MRWLPVRIILPLTLAFSAIMIGGGFWWIEHQREIGQIERESQINLSRDLYRAVAHLEYALAHDDAKAIDIDLAMLADTPGMEWIALISPEGRVMAASRRAWIGRPIGALNAPDLQRLAGALRDPELLGARLNDDRSAVLAAFAVNLPARDGALRDHREALLLARADISRFKRVAEAEIRREAALVTGAMLLVALLLGLGAHFGLTRRMHRIIRAAQAFGRGDLDARTGVTGRDELGRIGESFDAMAKSVQDMSMEMFKMRRAIESMREAVVITNRKGCIEYVNPAFTHITGYAFSEAIGHSPAMLAGDLDAPEFIAGIRKRLSEGKAWHGRATCRRKDGESFTAETSITPIRNQRGEITHFVAVAEDVTEREQIEAQLARAQKMEAVGTLVGGIAHDFNNMLAGMLGNLYLAKKRAAGDERIAQLLGRVEALGYRAADMIKQLLAFARQDAVEFQKMDLAEFVREAWRLAQVSVPENIRVCLDIEDAPMPIRGDATQIQQMLMNLLANARDAVRDEPEPKLEISLRRVEPDESFRKRHGLAARRFARLSVADNGKGIPKGDLARIFDPFYTTKAVGEGSGLGLAMIYGAIERHGGVIEVSSEEGRGARFDLWFPLIEDAADEPDREAAPRKAEGELLLLADDEPIVLETMSEVLRQIGYRVETARDGREALELFARKPDAWHAVVLDVVMPRMGGVQAGLEMRKLREDLPVVFATGYDREHVLGAIEGMRLVAALTKPVHPGALQRVLEKLAGRPGTESGAGDLNA